jgi:hypothetical protein
MWLFFSSFFSCLKKKTASCLWYDVMAIFLDVFFSCLKKKNSVVSMIWCGYFLVVFFSLQKKIATLKHTVERGSNGPTSTLLGFNGPNCIGDSELSVLNPGWASFRTSSNGSKHSGNKELVWNSRSDVRSVMIRSEKVAELSCVHTRLRRHTQLFRIGSVRGMFKGLSKYIESV